LVVSTLLQAFGIFLALLSGLFAARQGYRYGKIVEEVEESAEVLAAAVDRGQPPDDLRGEKREMTNPAIIESAIAAKINEAIILQDKATKLDFSSSVVTQEVDVSNTEVTEGYWIPAGSMAERRIALLDRQSEQLEGRVGSVMAASETLSGRIDVMVQSLQLLLEDEEDVVPSRSPSLWSKLESLRVVGMNLSLQLASGEGGGDFFASIERFNDQLAEIGEELGSMNDIVSSKSTAGRRLQNTLDEGRRLQAGSDSLRERAQLLLEDAQRFRRQSEALIRGIQDGAVSNYPASSVRGKLAS
jgi:hypothetical protein